MNFVLITSLGSVIVLDADDIIFAEIAAGLDLDQLEQDLTGEAVNLGWLILRLTGCLELALLTKRSSQADEGRLDKPPSQIGGRSRK